jgi:hypothetical protein
VRVIAAAGAVAEDEHQGRKTVAEADAAQKTFNTLNLFTQIKPGARRIGTCRWRRQIGRQL